MSVAPLSPEDPPEVGGYILEGRLGRGGQATVYLGRTATGEAVAVKVFDAAWMADPEARQRLAAEIDAARSVAPFGIARLLEARPDADPAYLVSEYVPGPNLATAVATRGPLRGAALDRFALATLTGLRAIHQAGLVHRDLKPANVLLGPDGPRIVDFGIAARRGQIESAADGVLGTREYLAPELLDGGEVSPAADLYAWAATVGFAASGHVPAGADDELPGASAALATVLRRCLDPDPEHRPDAVEAMELVLEAAHHSRHEPVLDAPRPLPATEQETPADTGGAAVPAWGTPPPAAQPVPASTAPAGPKGSAGRGAPRVVLKKVAAPETPSRSATRGMLAWVALALLAVFALINVDDDSGPPGAEVFPGPDVVEMDPLIPFPEPVTREEVEAVEYPAPSTAKPGDHVTPGRTLTGKAANRLGSLPLDPAGATVITQEGCTLVVWSTARRAAVSHQPIDVAGSACSAAAISPDQRFLVRTIGEADGVRLTVTDRSGVLPDRSTTLGGEVARYEFSPDSRSVALGLAGGRVLLWSLIDHRLLAETEDIGGDFETSWAGGADQVFEVAVPDGLGARFWNTLVGDSRTLPVGAWSGQQLVISPDGTRFAVVREGRDAVAVWDLAAAEPVATLVVVVGRLEALAFSPDGRYLAGVGNSGGQVWDVATGRPVGRLGPAPAGGADPRPVEVRFSVGGGWLFARSASGAITSWALPTP